MWPKNRVFWMNRILGRIERVEAKKMELWRWKWFIGKGRSWIADKWKSISSLGLDNAIGGASLWDPAVRSRGTSMGLVHKRPTSTNTVPFYVHTHRTHGDVQTRVCRFNGTRFRLITKRHTSLFFLFSIVFARRKYLWEFVFKTNTNEGIFMNISYGEYCINSDF